MLCFCGIRIGKETHKDNSCCNIINFDCSFIMRIDYHLRTEKTKKVTAKQRARKSKTSLQEF